MVRTTNSVAAKAKARKRKIDFMLILYNVASDPEGAISSFLINLFNKKLKILLNH